MSETQHSPTPDVCVGCVGFRWGSACFKSHDSAAFRESKGMIFQVLLNPTYEVKSVLCRVPSVRGTSALRLEETFSVHLMFNRTHFKSTCKRSIFSPVGTTSFEKNTTQLFLNPRVNDSSLAPEGRHLYRKSVFQYLEPRRGDICVEPSFPNPASPVGAETLCSINPLHSYILELFSFPFLGRFWIPRTGRSGFLTAPDPPKTQ